MRAFFRQTLGLMIAPRSIAADLPIRARRQLLMLTIGTIPYAVIAWFAVLPHVPALNDPDRLGAITGIGVSAAAALFIVALAYFYFVTAFAGGVYLQIYRIFSRSIRYRDVTSILSLAQASQALIVVVAIVLVVLAAVVLSASSPSELTSIGVAGGVVFVVAQTLPLGGLVVMLADRAGIRSSLSLILTIVSALLVLGLLVFFCFLVGKAWPEGRAFVERVFE